MFVEQGRHLGKRERFQMPAGWEIIYTVRKTGLKKGMRDRYFVTPHGVLLKTKKEMQARLCLDTLPREYDAPDHLS